MHWSMRAAFALCVLGASTVLLSSCWDGGTSAPPTPGAIELVDGDAQTGTVAAALGAPLRVRVLDEDGEPMSGVAVAWAAVSGAGVLPASAATGEDGVAHVTWTLGTVAGTQLARATLASIGTVDFSATAEPGALAGMTVTPAEQFFDALGDSVRIALAGADEFGNAVPTPGVTWSSSGSAVSVEDGVVRALENGTADVTATLGGVSATASFIVQQDAHGLNLEGAGPFTSLGDTARLGATVHDRNGNLIVEAIVIWSSLDTTIVSVDLDGLATARARGTARLVATTGLRADTVLVEVTPIAVTVEVEASAVELVYGSEASATAGAFDARGNALTDATIVWSSSDSGTVAVSATGALTAAGAGSTWVFAQSDAARDSVQVSVTPIVYELTGPAATVQAFTPLVAGVPAGVVLPDTATGHVGSVPVLVVLSGDTAITALLPDVGSGARRLVAPIDRNHLFGFDFTAAAAQDVADPDLLINDALADVQHVVDSIGAQLPIGEDGSAAGAIDAVRALLDLFEQEFAEASPEERQAVAQFIAANPSLFPGGTTSGSGPAGSSSTAAVNDLLKIFVGSAAALHVSNMVFQPALRTCLMPVTSSAGCPTALIAAAGMAASFTLMLASLDRILELSFVPTDAFGHELADDEAGGTSIARAPGRSLVSAAASEVVELGTHEVGALTLWRQYRTATASDAGSASGVTGEFFTALVDVQTLLRTVSAAFAELAALFGRTDIAMDGAGADFPGGTPALDSLDIGAEVAFVGTDDAEVTCEATTGPVVSLTCSMEAEEERAFGAIFRHTTDFGERIYAVPVLLSWRAYELVHDATGALAADTISFANAIPRVFRVVPLDPNAAVEIDYSLLSVVDGSDPDVTVQVVPEATSFRLALTSTGIDTTAFDLLYDGRPVRTLVGITEGYRVAYADGRPMPDTVIFTNGEAEQFVLVNHDGTPAADIDYTQVRAMNISDGRAAVSYSASTNSFSLTMTTEETELEVAFDITYHDRHVQRLDARLSTLLLAFFDGGLVQDIVSFELEQPREFRLVLPDGTPADIDYQDFVIEVTHPTNEAVMRSVSFEPDRFGITLEGDGEQWAAFDVLYQGRRVQTVQARLLGLQLAYPDGQVAGEPVSMTSGRYADFTLVNSDGSPVDFVDYMHEEFWVSDTTGLHSVAQQRSATGFSVKLVTSTDMTMQFQIRWRGRVLQLVDAWVQHVPLPDTLLLGTGEVVELVSPFGDSVVWSTNGGTITDTGVFTAGDSTGRFYIAVTMPGTTMTDTAQVDVVARIVAPSGMSIRVHDMNDDKTVVGVLYPTGENPYSTTSAFIWKDGVLTNLGTLGGVYAGANAINNAGQVVGHVALPDAWSGGEKLHAFLWENGTLTLLGDTAYPSRAVDINENGQVLGHYYSGSVGTTAFVVWSGGSTQRYCYVWTQPCTTTEGDTLSGRMLPYAINDAGQFVGTAEFMEPYTYTSSDGQTYELTQHFTYGVVFDGAQIRRIEPPVTGVSGTGSGATDIDNAGRVVGETWSSGAGWGAFSWESGIRTDLPMGLVDRWVGTNDAGQIAATGIHDDDPHWGGGLLVDADGAVTRLDFMRISALNGRGHVAGHHVVTYNSPPVEALVW